MAIRRDPLDCAIAVFARAPVAGHVKTRLIPRLGAEGAAILHARLVEHTLAMVTRAGLGEVTLWTAGPATHEFFQRCQKRFGLRLRAQPDGDLGERMLDVFRHHAGTSTLLVGTDCPSMSEQHLRVCARALQAGADAVFLPAEDGGYGLVGMRNAIGDIFNAMPWSTENVMEETRQRLRARGLVWREPAVIWDVDRPEDYDRLKASGLLDFTPPTVA